MIFLSALLDVCELNHAKDIEKQLNEQFLKDTDVAAGNAYQRRFLYR